MKVLPTQNGDAVATPDRRHTHRRRRTSRAFKAVAQAARTLPRRYRRTTHDDVAPAAPPAVKLRKGETMEASRTTTTPRSRPARASGMFINTSGNVRNGQTFVLVRKNGKEYHIYGTGKDRLVVGFHMPSSKPADDTGSTGGSTSTPKSDLVGHQAAQGREARSLSRGTPTPRSPRARAAACTSTLPATRAAARRSCSSRSPAFDYHIYGSGDDRSRDSREQARRRRQVAAHGAEARRRQLRRDLRAPPEHHRPPRAAPTPARAMMPHGPWPVSRYSPSTPAIGAEQRPAVGRERPRARAHAPRSPRRAAPAGSARRARAAAARSPARRARRALNVEPTTTRSPVVTIENSDGGPPPGLGQQPSTPASSIVWRGGVASRTWATTPQSGGHGAPGRCAERGRRPRAGRDDDRVRPRRRRLLEPSTLVAARDHHARAGGARPLRPRAGRGAAGGTGRPVCRR